MDASSDTQTLLLQWQQGDVNALGRLIDKNRPWIEASARRQLGPGMRAKHETQDIVQESLLQLLVYKPRVAVENGAQFSGLVNKIIRNVVVGKHVWFSRDRRDMKREAQLPDSSQLRLDGSQKDVTRPDTAAARQEDRAVVRLALGLLSPEDREVIMRRHFEGQEFTEIGKALQTSADGARKRFDRALPRLFAILGKLRT